jgi:transposase-like protein
MSTTVNCASCSAKFNIPPSRLAGSKSGLFFCDRRCKGDWQTGRYSVTQPANKYRVVKRAGSRQALKEHRLVVEASIGRKLTRNEHVHHINGDKLDNRLSNLAIIEGGEHVALHHRLVIDVEAIKSLRSQGLSVRSIAKQMGVSCKAISRRLQDIGVDTSIRFLTWDFDKAVDMLKGGANRATIAKTLKINESTLNEAFSKGGVQCSDSRYKHTYDAARILSLHSTGVSIRGIAREIGIPYTGRFHKVVTAIIG